MVKLGRTTAAMLSSICGGCMSTGHVISGVEVHADTLGFIRLGVTTKTELEAQIPLQPSNRWSKERAVAYAWVTTGDIVHGIRQELVISREVYSAFCVAYDENDRVTRYKIIQVSRVFGSDGPQALKSKIEAWLRELPNKAPEPTP